MTPSDNWTAAESYDAYMGRWSRPLARTFVDWLSPPAGFHWLDVGCGTGALAAAVHEQAAPASVVGCDPSAGFIEHARQCLADARLTFELAGVEALPERQDGFDAVVSLLALNFFPDPGRGLACMMDRGRTGAIIAASVWDYADAMTWLRTFWDAAVALDPGASVLDEGQRFPICRQAALEVLFGEAGLAQVESAPLDVPTVFATFEDYWTPFLRATGPAPAYVASLDAGQRLALEAELRRRLPIADNGRIELAARAWGVRGVTG